MFESNGECRKWGPVCKWDFFLQRCEPSSSKTELIVVCVAAGVLCVFVVVIVVFVVQKFRRRKLFSQRAYAKKKNWLLINE